MGGVYSRSPYNPLDYCEMNIVGLTIGTFEPIWKIVYFDIKSYMKDCKKFGVIPSVYEGELFLTIKL